MYTRQQMMQLIQVSDTTLKRYEDLKLLPEVKRTAGGQRRYEDIHYQGFKTIRALLKGFKTPVAHTILRGVLKGDFAEAFWLVAESQKELVAEKERLAQIRQLVLNMPERKLQQETMRIGELAKFAQVETSALRYWEERGLLVSQRDSQSGYRYYGKSEIKKAVILPLLRKTVYQIEEMKKILAGLNKDNLVNLKHHYEKIAQKNDDYLAQQLVGIKELMIYCEALQVVNKNKEI